MGGDSYPAAEAWSTLASGRGLPPWRPADITGSGRDQLRAIGFSV
jgi:hypothetical protein